MKVEQLRQLEQAASRGEWEATVLGSEGYMVVAPPNGEGRFSGIRRPMVARCGNEAWEVDKANAELIAAMRNCLPALLDIAEAMQDADPRCTSWRWEPGKAEGTRVAVDCGECWACRGRAALSRLDTEGGT